LRQTDSNKERGGGGGVGWVFFIAAGTEPEVKVQFSSGFVFPLWYLQSD